MAAIWQTNAGTASTTIRNMKISEIRDELFRELGRPDIYLPDELIIAETKRAMRETANHIDVSWIRFDKKIKPNIRWYKFDKTNCGFEILQVRNVFIDETKELIPHSLSVLIPDTETNEPESYKWFNDDNVPICLVSPTPDKEYMLNVFCKGLSPVTNVGEIPMPMFTHNAIAHYTKYLLLKIFKLKDDAHEEKEEWVAAVNKINKDYKDKIPFQEDLTTEIIWVDIDGSNID